MTQRKKLIIICPSNLPVPAVNGGAIETLIQNFIDENEIQQALDILIVSNYSKLAFEESINYKLTKFIWLNNEKSDLIIKLYLKTKNFLNRIFNQEKIPLSIESNQIKKIINSTNYDFVLVEGNGDQLSHLKNIVPKEKLFFHIHSYHHCIDNFKNKLLMNIPNKIISVSDFIKNSLINNLGLNCNQIITVKNCVGNQFLTTGKYPNTKVENSKINFVFTGRIVKEKGIIELIKALSILKEIPNWHLNIVGSFGSNFGSDKNLNKKADSEKVEIMNELSELDGYYTIHGYVNNKLISNLYENFSLAFSPSICKDAAPLVIGEYIASGIPVIASNQGGIPEYLEKGCGLILKLDNDFINNLSISIKNLLTNKSLIHEMSRNCYLNKSKFSANEYFKSIIAVFNS
jgi:spore coat protein SA